MKKVFLFVATAMLLSSCGALTGTPSSSNQASGNTATAAAVQTNPSAQGQAAGSALKSLYSQYKADGKYDAGNMNNIINTLTLVNNCQGLKTNVKDSEFWKSFAGGLILGSDMLVNTSNVDQITNGLQTMVNSVDASKLQAAVSNAGTAVSNVSSAASSISSILSMFK